MFELVFRKKDSTKHALIAMLEKARKVLGQDGTFVTLSSDL